jgi:hypothetical protein
VSSPRLYPNVSRVRSSENAEATTKPQRPACTWNDLPVLPAVPPYRPDASGCCADFRGPLPMCLHGAAVRARPASVRGYRFVTASAQDVRWGHSTVCRDAFTTMINNRAAPVLARDKGFARKTMTSNSPTDRQSALRQVELGRAGAVALNVIVRTIER